jgi:PadR family transcriptional regulator, regulatory protein PadR
LILKALARNGEVHGYEIARWIEQVSDEVLQVEEGPLYPALQRMLIKGWIKAKWGVTAGNRRARYYRLTSLGRGQLEVEVSEFKRGRLGHHTGDSDGLGTVTSDKCRVTSTGRPGS